MSNFSDRYGNELKIGDRVLTQQSSGYRGFTDDRVVVHLTKCHVFVVSIDNYEKYKDVCSGYTQWREKVMSFYLYKTDPASTIRFDCILQKNTGV